MPRLGIFAVCEKVILDDSGMASLINLFSRISILAPKEGLPSSAVAPKEWAAFASWSFEEKDRGKEFDQSLQVLAPNKTVFTEIKSKVVMQEDRDKTVQFRMPIIGLPVGEVGDCTIRLSLSLGGSVIVEPPPLHIRVDHTPLES